MPAKKVNKVQTSKRTSHRKGGGDDVEPSPDQVIDNIIDMLQKLKGSISTSKTADSEQVTVSTNNGDSDDDDVVKNEDGEDKEKKESSGGKGRKKSTKPKKSSKSRKWGGSDILVGAPIINTTSLLQNADPTTQANAYVPALFTPPPFSAGIPQYATSETGFPAAYLHAMSGKYEGGAKKSKRTTSTTRKAKK